MDFYCTETFPFVLQYFLHSMLFIYLLQLCHLFTGAASRSPLNILFKGLAPHRLGFPNLNTVYMCSVQIRFCGIATVVLRKFSNLNFWIDRKQLFNPFPGGLNSFKTSNCNKSENIHFIRLYYKLLYVLN